MQRMHLAHDLLSRIGGQARRAYPAECCGFLLGKGTSEDRLVCAIEPVLNHAPPDQARDRYQIAPRDYLRIGRQARPRGWDIVGCYHSHPDGPAIPSATDLARAWPWYLYLIVAVHGGTVAECNGWILEEAAQDRTHHFRAVLLEEC